jgi:ribosome-dependent ATPase
LIGTALYVVSATAIGLVMSSFTRSQVGAIFGTAVITLIPAKQFSGFITPVSALQGFGAFVGQFYPTTHLLVISRGTFAKALHFGDLLGEFLPLLLAIPVLICVAAVLLKKQEA